MYRCSSIFIQQFYVWLPGWLYFPSRQDALRQAVADVADVEAQLENPETQLDFKSLTLWDL